MARNACGRVGALLADLSLQGFGLAAFAVPIGLLYLGNALRRQDRAAEAVARAGAAAALVIAIAIEVTLIRKFVPYGGSLILTGGILGAAIADFLLAHFSWAGALIVGAVILSVTVIAVAPARWLERLGQAGSKLAGFMLDRAKSASRAFGAEARGLARGARQRAMHSLKNGWTRLREALRAKQAMERDAEPRIPNPENALPEETAPFTRPPMENASSPDAGRDLLIVEERKAPPPKALSLQEPVLGPVLGPAPHTERASRFTPRASTGPWRLPSVEFLRHPPQLKSQIDRERLVKNSELLERKFKDFGIDGRVTIVHPGPVITLYEFQPGTGVKISRIQALADDLSMALSAQSVRIIAPLPGKPVVGIEIPSETRETVYLKELIQSEDFKGKRHSIPIAMGKDIGGQTVVSDLGKMPHLLCAGQTGSGKSVFMNNLICSLLYRFSPDELRLILVDPKVLEFQPYQDIPHLLLPVVDTAKAAGTALKWAVKEMDRRYRILAQLGARNLASFNEKVDEMGPAAVRDLLMEASREPDGNPGALSEDWIEAFEPDATGVPKVGRLPFIVLIIDELADLMMVARKEVECSIARIAQKARAAGIHLVIATQRPSTDVVTGTIKVNLPSRLSFQLRSHIDSRTILDRQGGERLLGQGDMLFIPPGSFQLQRIHGAYVSDEEIEKITGFLRSQGKPMYRDEILVEEDDEEAAEDGLTGTDELFDEAVTLVKSSGHASASFLQRHFRVGYNRASRLIETMEVKGIVGPADGARPREVLIR